VARVIWHKLSITEAPKWQILGAMLTRHELRISYIYQNVCSSTLSLSLSLSLSLTCSVMQPGMYVCVSVRE